MAVSSTRFLLNAAGNVGDNVFIDTYEHVITPVGSPVRVATDGALSSAASMYLSGTSHLVLSNPEHFNLRNKTVTIEAWIKPQGVGDGTILSTISRNGFGSINGVDSGWELRVSAGGVVTFGYHKGASSTYTPLSTFISTLQPNEWGHVALVKTNLSPDTDNYKIFLNGVLSAELTLTGLIDSGLPAKVGRGSDTQFPNQFVGWIQDVSWTLDEAKYTTDFIPPLSSLEVDPGCDPFWSLTSLSTIVSGAGDDLLDNKQGGASLDSFIVGTKGFSNSKRNGRRSVQLLTGSHYSLPNTSAKYDFGVSSFTVEIDVNLTALGNSNDGWLGTSTTAASGSGWWLGVQATASGYTFRVNRAGTETTYTYSGGSVLNEWHTHAVQFDSSDNFLRFFRDGSLVESVAVSPVNTDSGNNLTIGRLAGESVGTGFSGAFTNIRVTKAARSGPTSYPVYITAYPITQCITQDVTQLVTDIELIFNYDTNSFESVDNLLIATYSGFDSTPVTGAVVNVLSGTMPGNISASTTPPSSTSGNVLLSMDSSSPPPPAGDFTVEVSVQLVYGVDTLTDPFSITFHFTVINTIVPRTPRGFKMWRERVLRALTFYPTPYLSVVMETDPSLTHAPVVFNEQILNATISWDSGNQLEIQVPIGEGIVGTALGVHQVFNGDIIFTPAMGVSIVDETTRSGAGTCYVLAATGINSYKLLTVN